MIVTKKINFKPLLLSISIIFFIVGLVLVVNTLKTKKEEPKDPIIQLTSIEPETLPTIVSAGDDSILFSWVDSESIKTNLRLLDVDKDTIKYSTELNGLWDLREAYFSDGSFILFNADNNQFCFLNEKLEEIDKFSPENSTGFFSHDRKNYFFLKDKNLYRTSLDSNESVKVDIPNNLRITNIIGIHPTKEELALHYAISPYSSQNGTAIYDFNSNKLLMLQDKVYQVDMWDNNILLMEFNENEMKYSYTYGNKDFYNAPAGLFKNDNNLIPIHGSNNLLSSMGSENKLYYLDKEIKVSSLKSYGIVGEFNTVSYLPKKEVIVISGFNNDKSITYLIYPSRLSSEYFAKAEKIDSPLKVPEGIENSGSTTNNENPKDMNEVRELADKLENKYGIKILLSSQCRSDEAFFGYDFYTTDEMNYSDEPKRIAEFLNELDQALALYPEDFFKQFKNKKGNGGVRFLPIGKIKSEVKFYGVCYENNEWENIALDIDADNLVSNICHEIWHATEYKILASNENAFNKEKWIKLNPKDFKYYELANLLNPNEKKWTIFSAGNEGIYFVDDYSKLNEKEDRARIMEYIMTKEDFAEEMMKSKAIFKKYQIMCDGIRDSFDTTEWSNVRWERFLENRQ